MNKRALWAERVAAWRASGLPSKSFCEGKPFSDGGLRFWASRLRNEPHTSVTAEASPAPEPTPPAMAPAEPVATPGQEPVQVRASEVTPAAVVAPAPVAMARVVRRRSGSRGGPARPKSAPQSATPATRETAALVLEWGALHLAVQPGFDRETLGVVLDLLAERGGAR